MDIVQQILIAAHDYATKHERGGNFTTARDAFLAGVRWTKEHSGVRVPVTTHAQVDYDHHTMQHFLDGADFNLEPTSRHGAL